MWFKMFVELIPKISKMHNSLLPVPFQQSSQPHWFEALRRPADLSTEDSVRVLGRWVSASSPGQQDGYHALKFPEGAVIL